MACHSLRVNLKKSSKGRLAKRGSLLGPNTATSCRREIEYLTQLHLMLFDIVLVARASNPRLTYHID
jgi:hypothetical protein